MIARILITKVAAMLRFRHRAFILPVVLFLTFGLVACDSALEEEPQTFRNPDNYYETVSEVEAAASGMYRPLLTYDGFKFPMWSDAACENDFTHCPSWFGGGMTGAWEGKWWQGNQWSGYYQVIAQANLLLQNVPESPVSEEIKDWGMGQAHFLRGYAYYSLAIRYGDVPIRDELYKPADGAFGDAERDPVSAVFQQAASDLKKAADELPPNYAAYQRGRPTAAAAKGLLAKTYLHMAGKQFTQDQSEPEWHDETLANNQQAYLDSARIWAGEVVTQAENNAFPSLADDYMTNFDTETQDESNEMLFSIQAAGHSDGGFAQGSEIPQYYNPGGPDLDGSPFHGGFTGDVTTLRHRWVQAQEDGDERFEVGTALHDSYLRYGSDPTYVKEAVPDGAVMDTTDDGMDNPEAPCEPDFQENDGVKEEYEGVVWLMNDAFCTPPSPENEDDFIRVSPRYYTRKYVDPGANTKFENGTNPVVLRYADVVLIYAEALARTGSQSEAFTQLNKVRDRAGVPYNSMSDISEPTLTETVWAERARELYAEHDRRFDLLRQGRYFERMEAVGKSRPPRKRLLPIPEAEINGNAMIDTNNPGY
jgi:hypothetical protein